MQDALAGEIEHVSLAAAGRQRWMLAAVLFWVSFAFLWIGRDRLSANLYDEGVIVYGAQRILQGDVPYRDFWVLYPPGQFFAVAVLFKIFGSSLLVERLWDIALRAAIASLTYLITARLSPQRYALLAWGMSLCWLWTVRFYGYPLIPALLLTLISGCFFIDYLHRGSGQRKLFAAGLFLGLLVAFRHDIAFYVYIAEGWTLVLVYLTERRSAHSIRPAPSSLLLAVLTLSGGVAAVVLPLAIYLLAVVPMEDLLDQLFIFPATVYPAVRSLPYPSIFSGPPEWILPFYFHFIVLAAATVYLASAYLSKRPESAGRVWKAALFLALLVGLMILRPVVRPDHVHLIYVLGLTFVLGALVWSAMPGGLPFLAVRAALAIAFGGMLVYPVLTAQVERGRQWAALADPTALTRSQHLPRAAGFVIPPDQQAMLDYVRAHVPPGDKIFVGVGHHDIVLLNDVLFYFFAERESATRYHELHPGQVTTAAVQRSIIEELQKNHVQYVVLYLWGEQIREPNESATSSQVRLLDDFLMQRYNIATTMGNYRVLERHD